MKIIIEELHIINNKTLMDINMLMKQLSSKFKGINKNYLQEIVSNQNTKMLVAKSDGKICGSACLAVICIPTGKKARIEDVVVSKDFRRNGIGFKLIHYCLEMAKSLGIQYVDLTSHPRRRAANELYQRVGFVKGETNVYRYTF